MKEMADTLMADLEKNGAVQRYDRPTPSTSPGHFVLKACGRKVRLVTDYRILNMFILRSICPLSSATDLMRRVQPDSLWFCKLDTIHGYFQVPLDEQSRLLTAFLLPDGKRHWYKVPIESTEQRLRKLAFPIPLSLKISGYDFAVCYHERLWYPPRL